MYRSSCIVTFLVLAVVGVTCVTGCSSHRDGNVHAQSTVSGAKESREDLIAAKTEIGKAIADLDLIIRHGDLKPTFRTFSDDLDALRKREKAVRSEREAMEADADAYIAQWQFEGAHYSNDELRKSSIDRQAAVKLKFKEVTKAYRALGDQFKPFITTLTELQGSLSNDLTASSVEAIKPVAATAVADGDKVQNQIDEVISQLDSMIASLSTEPVGIEKK